MTLGLACRKGKRPRLVVVDETDNQREVAEFTIHEDEHGWMWVLRYADKRRHTRLGRL